MRILCIAVLLSSGAFAQTVVPAIVDSYGCGGPFIPRVTTPEISLETVSVNPVGASNATYGLVAGATNATLSISNLSGNVGGTYTQPVWYAGGTTPLISTPAVQLSVPLAQPQYVARMDREREHERAEAPSRAWTYYAGTEETSSAAEASTSARSAKPPTRTITNQDVQQQNQKNGSVKYNGKTEQIK